jgi:hypothetical protein
MSGKRLRLVSVTIEPHFVVEEDGELSPLELHLRNEDGTPVRLIGSVPASQWAEYPSGKFLADVAEIEDRLNPDEDMARWPDLSPDDLRDEAERDAERGRDFDADLKRRVADHREAERLNSRAADLAAQRS